MPLNKNNKHFQNNLVKILNDLNIKKLNNKEINFFKKKKNINYWCVWNNRY